LVIAALVISANAAWASSCDVDLASAQALVDEAEAKIAAQGPTLPQTTAARQHRQPTPSSIAQAETSKDDSQPLISALKELESAKQANQSGDEAACESDVTEVRTLLAAH
jgi:hypothetical protein